MAIGKFVLNEFTIDNDVKKSGGEAIVSKAWHSRLGQVAIKEWTSGARDGVNEIELLIQNCDHQNIIQFLGILMDRQSNYIGYIMPYMSMGSLHDVIHNKTEKYDQKQISSWITQICCGLSHLHFKNIIHRDIKPNNVLLGKCHDDVKLSDFGMARSLQSINHTLTQLGTPVYMAPEIFEGGKYDFSADIYALAITIWEIIHRRVPYDHIDLKAYLPSKIRNGERPQLNDNVSMEVSDLLAICWHSDSSKRPTIDYILKFSMNTQSFSKSFENSVSECVTPFKNLNASTNNTLLPQIPLKEPSENFSIPKPIEQSSEKQTILLLGGTDADLDPLNTLLILENNGQNWKELSIKTPYIISGYGAQFLNNNLYIFGGHGAKKNPINLTYKLSKSLQWEKMADMNKNRSNIQKSSAILNNQIWVCGGRSIVPQQRVEMYDPRTKARKFMQEINQGRWSSAATVLNTKTVSTSGLDIGALKSVEMYDPVTNTWKYMKQMNTGRASAVATVINGKIVCSGGWNGEYMFNSVEVYDPSSDVWGRICDTPQSIFGHGAVEIDGVFMIMGGSNGIAHNSCCFNNVWAFGTTNGKSAWIHKPSMSIPRRGLSIAKLDGKVFVCGGVSNGIGINSVEIFDGKVWRNGPEMPTTRVAAAATVIPTEFARFLK